MLTVLLALVALFASARTCAAVDEHEMTAGEEREDRALTLRFMERLRETEDFAPLLGEFFPEDFDRRLRQFVCEAPRSEEEDYLASFDRAALLRAEPGELRRAYVALANFWNLYSDELKVYHLSGETLEESSFGLPAGALLIRARVYPFEMAIARHEGRLRILAVYPDFDGD